MSQAQNRHIKLKYFLYIFSPFFILTLIFFMVMRMSSIKNELDQIKISEKISTESMHDIILNDLSGVTSDLLYLSQSSYLHSSLENPTADFDETADEYFKFIKYKKIYDQIRYIDETGMEIIRVNYRDGYPVIVEKDDLQNKKDRYYFTNTMKLNKGEIFMSYFDLNIENKSIEVPYKPILRFATPVFDKTGKNKGLVIVNYLGKNILDDLKNSSDPEKGKSYFITNNSSYYLMHEDAEKEWGFMFDEKKSVNLKNEHPELWNGIEKNMSGQLLIDNTLYTYIKIDPTEDEYVLSSVAKRKNNKKGISSKYRWVIISSISEKYILQIKSDIDQSLIWKFGLLSIFIAFISSLYSKSKYSEYLSLETIRDKNLELTEKNKEIEIQKEALKDMNSHLEDKNEKLFLHSTIDPLTQTYSRRYFTELFSKELTKSKRHQSPLCCIIFDIDHFKKVNDNYGHLAGDYILQSISKIIHGEIRNEDIFGRYGGDEFLIALPATNLKDAEIAAEKIRKSIHNETFVFDQINIKVTLSMGISVANNSADTIEAVIENSDSALYLAKKNGRNRVEVYQEK